MNIGIGHKPLLVTSLCVLAACVALASCKKSGDQAPAGQVIAHVGPEVVTVQELENEFRLRNIPQDKRSDAVTRAFLQEIVLRKYLARQAVDTKIDREPTTLLGIIRAKEDLLAKTYFGRRLEAKATGIGKADVAKYIGEHPERFASRQIFSIDQLNVSPGQQTKALIEATKDYKTLAEVEKKCVELGVQHSRTNGELDTAAMPEKLFKALEKKGGDDLFFIQNGPATGAFFRIVSKRAAPLGGEEANKLASQALRARLADEEKRQVLAESGATATYEGDYAKIAKEPAASQPPATESAPPSPALADPASAPAPSEGAGGDALKTPEAAETTAPPPVKQVDAPPPPPPNPVAPPVKQADVPPSPPPTPAPKPKAPAKTKELAH